MSNKHGSLILYGKENSMMDVKDTENIWAEKFY